MSNGADNPYLVVTDAGLFDKFKEVAVKVKKVVVGKDVVELRAQVQTLKDKNEALQEKALQTVQNMRALASGLQQEIDEIATRR